MKKDFDVIQKKINLHGNEITRIQGLSGKMAIICEKCGLQMF